MKSLLYSIRARVLFLIILPVVLLFSFLVVISHDITDQIILENLRNSITNYSQTISLAISVHLGTGNDLHNIVPFLSEFIGFDEQGIRFVALYDENQQLLAQTAGAPAFQSIQANAALQAGILQQNRYDVGVPILLFGDQVGMLYYGIGINSLVAAVSELFSAYLNQSILIFSALIIAIFILSFAILLGINRRMKNLLEHSKQIARGAYHEDMRDHSADEIGQFSLHLDSLRHAIRNRVEDLQQSQASVVRLNQDLTQAMQQLQMSQESLIQSEKLAGLGSIVAAVAHELNTPIGNALGVATTMQEKTTEFQQVLRQGLKKSTLEQFLLDNETAQTLMVKNLFNAAELVESFKHVAVDQTSSKRRQFELGELLEDIGNTLGPTIKNLPISIEMQVKATINMDSYPGPLGQVITNLCNNAVIHAFEPEQGGLIAIAAEPHHTDKVVLSVKDNGKGIAAKQLKKIFDPFFTTRLGQGGSGLGLHIVYNLVTGVLGGSIEVKSEPGKGTEFIINIPMVAAHEVDSPDESIEAFA